MSIWGSKRFYTSCDVDLDLKIYVGSVQLRTITDAPTRGSECYVSLQLVDGGVPLHPFARSTSLGFVSGSKICWNEWVAIPFKIKDLPQTAQVVVRLWTVDNECFAGATLRCFDSKLALRRGHTPIVIWKRGLTLEKLAGKVDPATDSPLALLLRTDDAASRLKALEGHFSGDEQACPWTDRLAFVQLQRELLHSLAGQDEAARRSTLLPGSRQNATASTTASNNSSESSDSSGEGQLHAAQNGASTSGGRSQPQQLQPSKDYRYATSADALILGYGILHFPLFQHPVLYEEPTSEAGAVDRMAPPLVVTASSAARQAAISAIALAQASSATAAAAGMEAGADASSAGNAAADVIARAAYWSDSLCMIYDPEEDGELDNPSDNKYHKLARGGVNVEVDPNLKPNRAELSRIQAIVGAQDFGFKLTPEMRDILWKFRYTLLNNKRAALKFISAIDWEDDDEAREGAHLLSRWAPIEIEDALRLLCPEFTSQTVRQFAVQALKRASDDDLSLFLLQLVQALRYEVQLQGASTVGKHTTTPGAQGADAPGAAEAGAGNAESGARLSPTAAVNNGNSSSSSSSGVRLSPLADFLLERCSASLQLGMYLHWYLRVGEQDAKVGPLFSSVHTSFLQCLPATAMGQVIADTIQSQEHFLRRLQAASAEATSVKRDRVETKIEKLNKLFVAGGPYDDIVVMTANPIPALTCPDVLITGIQPRGAHMFKSALYPTVITLRVSPESRIDWAASQAPMCGLTVNDAARKAAVDALYHAQHGSSSSSHAHHHHSHAYRMRSPTRDSASARAAAAEAAGSSSTSTDATGAPTGMSSGLTSPSRVGSSSSMLVPGGGASGSLLTPSAGGVAGAPGMPGHLHATASAQQLLGLMGAGASSSSSAHLNISGGTAGGDHHSHTTGGAGGFAHSPQDVASQVAEAVAASVPAGTPPATYKLVFKNGDDMRQDQLIIQMIRLMDNQLKRVGLDLRLTPYSVLATSMTSGVMEMVLNCMPVSAVLEKYRGNPVQSFFREKHPAEGAEFGIEPEVMDTYVKSCAGYCVITYLLGIGDRHLDNIMLQSSGHFFHLDFGYIFGRDPKPMPPPMRITKEMIDGMGGPQSANYSRFKSYCCQAYNILRRSANLVTVLLTLMRDAGIEDLHPDPVTTIAKLHEKFRVDVDDEAADAVFLRLVDDSVAAMFPAFLEVLHKIRVAMR